MVANWSTVSIYIYSHVVWQVSASPKMNLARYFVWTYFLLFPTSADIVQVIVSNWVLFILVFDYSLQFCSQNTSFFSFCLINSLLSFFCVRSLIHITFSTTLSFLYLCILYRICYIFSLLILSISFLRNIFLLGVFVIFV